ncbi:outer membrane protein/outer membrane protein, S-layer protein transport system [Novosphingobium mathurense]|uniref:Outer membrane protein/outer membrane protein, S-layer protein transport system n=1 Tax=Novosphingobium mathurense TaxID=428990 RepID=A0A1U6HJD9_9SPHN|nr:outer membrane protein/outer membrane protein, S-layer protein transport system [Novosphingobium mathurense]
MKCRAFLHLSIGLFAALSALKAKADTLEQAIARAHENNPQLKGTKFLARAADAAVIRAKGAYGPSLSVSVRHEYTFDRTTLDDLAFDDQGLGTTASLSLSQPLFTSGRLAAGLDSARANRMIAQENLRAASQQLTLDVVNAYASLQRDIALYRVARDIHALLAQQRDVTAARFRLRDSTRSDLDQTTNRLEIAAGRVIRARAAVETSAARYRNIVGAYPDDLAALPDIPPVPPLSDLYAQADASNPQVRAARYTALRSRAAVASARAAMGPQFSAFASAERAPLTPYQNTRRVERVVAGVSLAMPLHSGGQLTAALREAEQRNLADSQFAEQTRRDVRETLATDWNLYRAAAEALPRFDAAVRAAESAVAGVKRQETAGIRTLREVLEVTNDLLTARTSAAETRAELFIRKVAVLRDAGILGPEMFDISSTHLENDVADESAPQPFIPAGLPLRPILDPFDRILSNSHVPQVPVLIENDETFLWDDGADGLKKPSP